MNLNYFDTDKINHLVEQIFELTFSSDAVPFQTTIMPLEYSNLTYIASGKPKTVNKQTETTLENLMVTGQFFRSYQYYVDIPSKSFGLSFHPTALYKLLHTDISKLENKHVPLKQFHRAFYDQIIPIFENDITCKDFVKKLKIFLAKATLTITKDTDTIDKAINLIREKEGLLTINELLNDILISQKSLELQFKKIVGITPGKYIRKYRFLKLMRKFESQEIELKDLIYMYNYYDQSHFSKDFKLFMKESPTSYFKKEYPLIKEYLKK